jgi:hypothetical protein
VRLSYGIRKAVGGYVVQVVDTVEEEEVEEIVFTSLAATLGYLRAELLGQADPTEAAPAEEAEP